MSLGKKTKRFLSKAAKLVLPAAVSFATGTFLSTGPITVCKFLSQKLKEVGLQVPEDTITPAVTKAMEGGVEHLEDALNSALGKQGGTGLDENSLRLAGTDAIRPLLSALEEGITFIREEPNRLDEIKEDLQKEWESLGVKFEEKYDELIRSVSASSTQLVEGQRKLSSEIQRVETKLDELFPTLAGKVAENLTPQKVELLSASQLSRTTFSSIFDVSYTPDLYVARPEPEETISSFVAGLDPTAQNRPNLMVILAEMGMGKTWLTAHAALSLLEKRKAIPLYFRLNLSYEQQIRELMGKSLGSYDLEILKKLKAAIEEGANASQTALVVFLDGLDEVRPRTEAGNVLEFAASVARAGIGVILTCRRADWESNPSIFRAKNEITDVLHRSKNANVQQVSASLLLDKFSSEDTDILLRRYGLNPETLPRGVLALSSRPYMARLFAEWNRLIGSVPDPNDGEAFVKFVFGDTEIPEELTVAHRAGLTPDDRETLFKILDMFYTPNGCKDTLPKAQLSAADENRDAWSAIISSGFLIERALPYGVEVTVNPDFREPLQVACERWREFAKRPAQPTAQPTTPQIKIEPTTLWSHQTEGSVYDMAMSDDGEYVAAGSEDGKIYFFNKGGKLLWSHKTGSPVGRVTITTDGDYVAAATKDGKIYILDKDGKLLWSHEVSFGSAHHMAMSPDGDHVAAAGSKGEIYFFGKDRKLLWSHHNTGGPAANGLAMMTMDEEYRVVAAFNDGNICIFDKDGKQLWSHETGGAKLPEPVKMAAMMTVKPSNSVAITTGEDNMAAAATDGKIYYFDFFEDKEGKPVWSYEIGGLLHDVAISRDGEYVAAVPTSDDAKIYFFDKSGKLLWSRKTVGETYVAISGDGKYVAAASSDHRVYFLDKTGNVLWSHQTGGPVNRVSISWDGEYVAAASSDHSVYFFLAWSGWG